MREEKRTEEHAVPRPRYLERIDKSLEAMRDSGRRSEGTYVCVVRVTHARDDGSRAGPSSLLSHKLPQ